MTERQAPQPRSQTPAIPLLLAILLLCAVAIAPLLRTDTPCSHDGAFHYYRVAAMRHALKNGILFTRYLPDLAFGYGYPFFNYRAALSYYIALMLHLTGLALPVALNLVYVLSIVASAFAAYLLARDLFGPQAGIVAAIAYAYAPYQFLDALLRANAPESVALPLMPLILWAFRRLALTGRRRWFLVSVGSLAGLLLTHNISSLLFVAFPSFLITYLFVLWLVYRQAFQWTAVGAALGLALGLTAFFWAPALLEQDYVQLHMSRITRNNDFHYNFLPLAEVFAPPTPVDTSLMNPPMHIHLGLAQAILGGIGLVGGLIRWHDRERRATLVFLALTAVVMIWISTRSSLWLWEHIPQLPFVQFPWRLVGRAILPVSLLAGASISALRPSRSSSTLTHQPSRHTPYPLSVAHYIAVAVTILSAFPLTYPPQGYCSNAPYPTISDVFTYERQSKLVGVDPEGSYFPVWVRQRPENGSPLEKQYARGGPIMRFDETVLPTGSTVVEADYGANRARVVVETPTGFRARYLAFYFPGWQVRVDDEPVEVTATDPEGLITFDIPPGNHTIVIRFGSTPVRTLFSVLSILSLAVTLALTLRYPETISPSADQQTGESTHRLPAIDHWLSVIGLYILAIALLVFKLAVVDRVETPFRRPVLQSESALPGVQHVLDQPYADGMTLIGYDQDRTMIPADDELRIDLYWTSHSQPTARYQTVIHLVGPDGMRWSLPDTARPRGYADYPPNFTWAPGHYAIDSHQVIPLPGTPPGTYDVVLTVFDLDSLVPLSLLNEQGQPAAPELTLGQATLSNPRHPTDLSTLDIPYRLDISLDPLTLLGARFDRAEAAPGDPIFLTAFWRAGRELPEDSNVSVQLILVAPDGSPATQFDLSPTPAWHPTSAWQVGEVWRGQHILRLPANLDAGDYTWRLAMEPIHQSTDLPFIIHVTAPPHSFTTPSVDKEIDIRLGSIATLVGITLEPKSSNLRPGTPFTATLAWRAEDTPATSYHVFLHLLNADGRLIAQSDGIPARWSRPTTGWLPGEYITDVHVLMVPTDTPPGEYTLYAGLYVPGGERISTPDGADAVLLTTITVKAQ